jgi:DNA transformation protein
MPSSPQFRDRMLGILLAFGPVVARPMFGGYGLYMDGLMFGLIANDRLYFKADDGNRQDFEQAGMQPFSYPGKSRPINLSYWEVPPDVMADPLTLADWAGAAREAALRSRKTTKPRKKKTGKRP